MGNLLFATDPHAGGNLPPKFDGDVSIYGQEWGFSALERLVDLTLLDPANNTLILGGDEITFRKNKPPKMGRFGRRPARNFRREYMGTAHRVAALLDNELLNVGRTRGNHDPIATADQKAVRLNRLTHIFKQHSIPDTDVVICQPDVTLVKKAPSFSYDPDQIISTIEETTNPNLIISSHWAFDRAELGHGYGYEDHTSHIVAYLQNLLNQGTLNSVLTIHGHSHRYRNTKWDNNGHFETITMPSIVQSDIDDFSRPCGLLMMIGLDAQERLKPTFHQLNLGTSEELKIVSRDYMERYERNKKPVFTQN